MTKAVNLAEAASGTVLQVVQTVVTTSTATSSTSFVDAGVSATITPKFSTSKILVIPSFDCFSYANAGSGGALFQIVRNSTNIFTQINYGQYNSTNYTSAHLILTNTLTYLDSPATTSATTYKVQFAIAGSASSATVGYANNPSVITLMEIAG